MDENSKLPGSSSGIQGGAKEKRVMKRCQFSMILLDCTDGNPTLLRQGQLGICPGLRDRVGRLRLPHLLHSCVARSVHVQKPSWSFGSGTVVSAVTALTQAS